MVAQPEVKDVELFRSRLPSSFTEHHQLLMDVAIGTVVPKFDEIRPLHPRKPRGYSDLLSLKNMVLLEFAASLAKNKKGNEEDGSASDPKPFDVFLLETTMERLRNNLAVCLPMTSGNLAWYDGFTRLWPVGPPEHKWRIASLSGPARVLEALSSDPSNFELMDWAMKREMIVSAVDDYDRLLARDTLPDLAGMNSSQKSAIATILDPRFDQGFLPIQGPPGCGKTTTLVAMIQLLGEKAIVTAPSNAAIANVALKLFQTGMYDLADLVVHGENCDTSVQFLSPRHRGERYANLCKELGRANISDDRKETLRVDFLSWLHVNDTGMTTAQLASLCPFIDLNKQVGRALYQNLVARATVVFSTLNGSGASVLRRTVSARTMFLDEASQCSEAEFYIATTFPGVRRIVVIGDPKQLPATVVDQTCLRAGFGISWLGSVLDFSPEKVHLLDTQYRMDPMILKFPNDQFYGGRILCGENVFSRTPFVAKPFLFVDTRRRGHEERDGFSYRNTYEVAVIRSLLFSDHDSDVRSLLKDSVHPRVIVITPYKAQAELLKRDIVLPKNSTTIRLDFSTVDSFQGQEGDLVIISTVRTHQIGFIDDPNRINVAMTRAKRLVRVVGDANFFLSMGSESTLKKLTLFATELRVLSPTKVKASVWSAPNWDSASLWKVSLTSRFQDCVKHMPIREQNVCLNTLHAISRCDIESLYDTIPRRKSPWWYTSALKCCRSIRVVWIAKMTNCHIIEAAFAGLEGECNRFVQLNHDKIPNGARIVLPGLSGVEELDEQNTVNQKAKQRELWSSWTLTNASQNLLVQGLPMPSGAVKLDEYQEEIACSPPPLIIESRSGTGKTLVLLQHAAYHSDRAEDRPACFVTVSPRLSVELRERYEAVNKAEHFDLPTTLFFHFRQLVESLLHYRDIDDFKRLSPCTYLGFVRSKKSYDKPFADPHLVENEIGGVIEGSLDAALQKCRLSRLQYLHSKRSNIGYDTARDTNLRASVYDEYEKYRRWKRENEKFDTGDMVLRLLQEDWDQPFASVYLDEVQDLSYASIYLLYKIGGKDSLRWVCAGDPAQMISPGCSFTFTGLKETLKALQDDDEWRCPNVSHLHVNYRTTKDVLDIANKVLGVARKYYPDSIPFTRPEIAPKDLGLKVVLCDWDRARQYEVKLGTNQAVVFSSVDDAATESSLKEWVGEHPFILSSLHSKGLEWDDVIVAFDFERKVWKIEERRVETLRMLRELYVAITRARRRVVILIRRQFTEMQSFFDDLQCDFQIDGAEMVLQNFHLVTSDQDWELKGREFFDNEMFEMAAKCFDVAGERGWCHWCRGKNHDRTGLEALAAMDFVLAIQYFGVRGELENVLAVCRDMLRPSVQRLLVLTDESKQVIERASQQYPNKLNRFDMVRLNLAREAWDSLTMDDLKDESLAGLFMPYRGSQALKQLIRSGTVEDRIDVQSSLPLVVADYHVENAEYPNAVTLYLLASSVLDAEKATECAIEMWKRTEDVSGAHDICQIWNTCKRAPTGVPTSLLLKLFQQPLNLDETTRLEVLRVLGRWVVISAFDTVPKDRTKLHKFNAVEFLPEIAATLSLTYPQNLVEVTKWFLKRNDLYSAEAFTRSRLPLWSNPELRELFICFEGMSKWLNDALKSRGGLSAAVLLVLARANVKTDVKTKTLRDLGISQSSILGDHPNEASILVWAIEDAISSNGTSAGGRRQGKRKETKRQAQISPGPQGKDRLARLLFSVWPHPSSGEALDSSFVSSVFTEDLIVGLLSWCVPIFNKAQQAQVLNYGAAVDFMVSILTEHGYFIEAIEFTLRCKPERLSDIECSKLAQTWSQIYQRLSSKLFRQYADHLSRIVRHLGQVGAELEALIYRKEHTLASDRTCRLILEMELPLVQQGIILDLWLSDDNLSSSGAERALLALTTASFRLERPDHALTFLRRAVAVWYRDRDYLLLVDILKAWTTFSLKLGEGLVGTVLRDEQDLFWLLLLASPDHLWLARWPDEEHVWAHTLQRLGPHLAVYLKKTSLKYHSRAEFQRIQDFHRELYSKARLLPLEAQRKRMEYTQPIMSVDRPPYHVDQSHPIVAPMHTSFTDRSDLGSGSAVTPFDSFDKKRTTLSIPGQAPGPSAVHSSTYGPARTFQGGDGGGGSRLTHSTVSAPPGPASRSSSNHQKQQKSKNKNKKKRGRK